MIYVIWLLIVNRDFAAGAAASDIVFALSPWIVAIVGIGGIAFALVMRKYVPSRYEIIGRVVLDVRERDQT